MEEIKALLENTSYEKREGLGTILGTDGTTAKELIDQLRWNYQPWWNSLFGCEPDYREIVQHIAQHLQVNYPNYYTSKEIEICIAQRVLETIWEKMTPEQRQEMEVELRKTAQKFDKTGSLAASSSVFAALTTAKLSGFGIYLLASTSLGALTAAFNITLPFVVYTTMSSTIAMVIGPVGWISAALFALWKSGDSNKQRLISAIMYICMLRAEACT